MRGERDELCRMPLDVGGGVHIRQLTKTDGFEDGHEDGMMVGSTQGEIASHASSHDVPSVDSGR